MSAAPLPLDNIRAHQQWLQNELNHARQMIRFHQDGLAVWTETVADLQRDLSKLQAIEQVPA